MAKKVVIGRFIFDALTKESELEETRNRLLREAQIGLADPAWQPEQDRGETSWAALIVKLDVYRHFAAIAAEATESERAAAKAYDSASDALVDFRESEIAPLAARESEASESLIDRLTNTAMLGRDPDSEDGAFDRFREVLCETAKARAALGRELGRRENAIAETEETYNRLLVESNNATARADEAKAAFLEALCGITVNRIRLHEGVIAALKIKPKKLDALRTALKAGLLVGSDSLAVESSEG